METLENQTNARPSNNWQLSVKMLIIVALMLLLLIPKVMIMSLIDERERTSRDVRNETMEKWSLDQTIRGPILTLPYIETTKDSEGKILQTTLYCHFLPKKLTVDGEIVPQKLNRNIYEAEGYTAGLKINGSFDIPDLKSLQIKPEDVLWDKAEISLSINDLRGINNEVNMKWNGATYPFSPGLTFRNAGKDGLSLPLPETSFPATFEIDLSLKGSDWLKFAPLGETTNVKLKSSWTDPKFDGHYLPTNRDVSNGFTAEWNITRYNRNYPQQWTGSTFDVTKTDFGVNLLKMADHYQKSTRSAKYSFLIILLIFLSFFLNEFITKQKIHTLQYILVGAAVLMFYVLLLSFSEHIGFNMAYLVATVLVTGMILIYSHSFLRTWANSLLLTFILILSLGFVFILLQLETYSLLAGSIGLFVVLGLTMYFTNKIKLT